MWVLRYQDPMVARIGAMRHGSIFDVRLRYEPVLMNSAILSPAIVAVDAGPRLGATGNMAVSTTRKPVKP
jgi:hypothetical protein